VGCDSPTPSKNRMHNYDIVTPATTYPVPVSEVKDHLNISSSTRDNYIQGLVKTATSSTERFLNRKLMTQTWVVYYDNFCDVMRIPFGTLQSITHVKYYDLDGELQTLDPANYWVVKETDPGYIKRGYDVTYPEVQYGRPNAVEIQFVCGYGSSADVPEDIKHAIKLLVTDYYENRGTVVLGNVSKIPSYLIDLIHSYKLYSI
jgi:uncharacterized phiE125 gp8 family phage protein